MSNENLTIIMNKDSAKKLVAALLDCNLMWSPRKIDDTFKVTFEIPRYQYRYTQRLELACQATELALFVYMGNGAWESVNHDIAPEIASVCMPGELPCADCGVPVPCGSFSAPDVWCDECYNEQLGGISL